MNEGPQNGYRRQHYPVAGNLFHTHDRTSFLGEIVVVDLFIMHRFDNAHADRMKDHQPREQVAIDQNDLVWMTLGKLFSGFREIGSRYEDPLCCLVRAKTTAEIPNVGFANGVVKIIFLRLYIDAVKA